MKPIDVHAERYRITRDYDTAVVKVVGSDETYVADDLPTLREIVSDLRESGAVRAESVTYRKALLADLDGFYSASLASVWPDDLGEPGEFPSAYGLHKWGLPVNRENLKDPAVRFLQVPYCSPDPTGHELLGKVNYDALVELERDDELADDRGIGSIGGVTVIDLDTEAGPSVLEAIQALENYPVIDEGALSQAEAEEAQQCWSDWGRRDVETALETALETDGDVTIEPYSDLESELLEFVYEQGWPWCEDFDPDRAARRWILGQSAHEPERAWNPSDDDVQAARVEALARLIELEAIELPEPDGPEPDPESDGARFRRAWVAPNPDSPNPAPALVRGILSGEFLLTHRTLGTRYGAWTVTHIPTGMGCRTNLANRERAVSMADALAAEFDWDFTDPHEDGSKFQRQSSAMRARIVNLS